MARPVPTAGEKIARAEWTARAVKLSLKGWSLRRIGALVGVSHEAVRRSLREEFERVRPDVEEIEALRAHHGEKLERREARLNRLVGAYWVKAKGGDTEAAKVVLDAEKGLDRVHVSQARLMGLDAPARSEVSGKDGAPIVFDLTGMSSEQLKQLASGLAEDDASDEGGAPAADPAGDRAPDGGDVEPAKPR